MLPLALLREAPLRLEHQDTLPAIAGVFVVVFAIFAGAVYALHSLTQPTILKYRAMSPSSPAPAAAPQSEMRQTQALQRERQVRTRANATWSAGSSYGAPH